MRTTSEELINKISNEVEARKEELLELVSELVKFPTVSPPARIQMMCRNLSVNI
jgi:acetylornithine deacetylase